MVITRPQAGKAFNHILDVVFEQGDGTPLKSSLIDDAIDDIFSLVSIDSDTINDLTYASPTDPKQRLPVVKGAKSLIRLFQEYVIHCNQGGFPINDWLQVTQQSFDEFRASPAAIKVVKYPSDNSSLVPPTSIKDDPCILLDATAVLCQTQVCLLPADDANLDGEEDYPLSSSDPLMDDPPSGNPTTKSDHL